jgi:hypothetical protein
MNKHLCATTLGVLLLATGCATTTSIPPLRSEFADVPLLEGLAYQPAESVIIETRNVRTARLVYRGRMEAGSAVVEMQKGLEANGWKLVRSTATGGDRTLQLYEKGEASLQLHIWEAGAFNYYTYVEVSGTRPLTTGPATAATTR